MDGEPALAMTAARRCRWVNIKAIGIRQNSDLSRFSDAR
jgi:hypothetical protein